MPLGKNFEKRTSESSRVSGPTKAGRNQSDVRIHPSVFVLFVACRKTKIGTPRTSGSRRIRRSAHATTASRFHAPDNADLAATGNRRRNTRTTSADRLPRPARAVRPWFTVQRHGAAKPLGNENLKLEYQRVDPKVAGLPTQPRRLFGDSGVHPVN